MKGGQWLVTGLAFSLVAAACSFTAAIGARPPSATPPAATPVDASPTSAPSSQPLVTYSSQEGLFSLQYPADYKTYLEEKPSVDGVIIRVPNNVTIVSTTSPNFMVSIEHFAFDRAAPLSEFVLQHGCGRDAASAERVVLAEEIGLLFTDTACGPVGSSILFVTHEDFAYRITIETSGAYREVEDPVMELLSTFTWYGEVPPQAGTAPPPPPIK